MAKNSAPLAGRTALITGAAHRLGAAMARKLHGAGARVVIHYRSGAEQAQQLAEALQRDRAGSVALVQADLLDLELLPQIIATAAAPDDKLDILVNNASTFYPTPFGSIDEQQFADLVGTNLRAPLFLSQAAAPLLRASKGLILNIVDIHGMRPLRNYPVYSIAKAGLIALTRSLARELGPEIRVNAIAPGPVLWPEDDGPDESERESIIQRTALKRAGDPDDIAKACLYFATSADYVTGQVLAVDGGRSVGW
ncbi:MAG: pteridine reductase [Steroidobacteraceae bacterium]